MKPELTDLIMSAVMAAAIAGILVFATASFHSTPNSTNQMPPEHYQRLK